MDNYINNYFYNNKSLGLNVIEFINSRPYLKSLAQDPLYLSVICKVLAHDYKGKDLDVFGKLIHSICKKISPDLDADLKNCHDISSCKNLLDLISRKGKPTAECKQWFLARYLVNNQGEISVFFKDSFSKYDCRLTIYIISEYQKLIDGNEKLPLEWIKEIKINPLTKISFVVTYALGSNLFINPIGINTKILVSEINKLINSCATEEVKMISDWFKNQAKVEGSKDFFIVLLGLIEVFADKSIMNDLGDFYKISTRILKKIKKGSSTSLRDSADSACHKLLLSMAKSYKGNSQSTEGETLSNQQAAKALSTSQKKTNIFIKPMNEYVKNLRYDRLCELLFELICSREDCVEKWMREWFVESTIKSHEIKDRRAIWKCCFAVLRRCKESQYGLLFKWIERHLFFFKNFKNTAAHFFDAFHEEVPTEKHGKIGSKFKDEIKRMPSLEKMIKAFYNSHEFYESEGIYVCRCSSGHEFHVSESLWDTLIKSDDSVQLSFGSSSEE